MRPPPVNPSMTNLSIREYFGTVYRTYLHVFLGKMSCLALGVKNRLYHVIIYIFGKVQGEYVRYILNVVVRPKGTYRHVVWIVISDFQVMT